jgi:hypothetical protein
LPPSGERSKRDGDGDGDGHGKRTRGALAFDQGFA